VSFYLAYGDNTQLSYNGGAEQNLQLLRMESNALGSNGYIEYDFTLKKNGIGGSATIRVYFGGTLSMSYTIAASSQTPIKGSFFIFNRASPSSQYAFMVTNSAPDETGTAGTSTVLAAADADLAIDTTVEQELKITAQLVNAADTLDIRFHLSTFEKA